MKIKYVIDQWALKIPLIKRFLIDVVMSLKKLYPNICLLSRGTISFLQLDPVMVEERVQDSSYIHMRQVLFYVISLSRFPLLRSTSLSLQNTLYLMLIIMHNKLETDSSMHF